MKKFLKGLLFSIASLLLLTSFLLSTLLGSVRAEYFKKLSTTLDFEAIPDLTLKYYLDDKDAAETGVYPQAKEITQPFQFTETTGSEVRYHIALPIEYTGLYKLDFAVDFAKGDTYNTTAFYTADLNNPVGCEIISKDSSYSFGSGTVFRISDTRIDNKSSRYKGGISAADSQKYMYSDANGKGVKLFYANGNFQWKTVAPSRKENVTLSFVADSADVTAGYVLWIWDFYGLSTGNYVLRLEDISFTKVDEPNSSDTYVDLVNMSYKNMCILPSNNSTINLSSYSGSKPGRPNSTYTLDSATHYHVEGHNIAGITHETGGRGTYVTQADYNGMTMQVEPLYYGFNHYDNVPYVGSMSSTYDYSNPVVLNIPINNVKTNTSYKVTFDFSIAQQGKAILDNGTNGEETTVVSSTDASYANYSTDLATFFSNDKPTNLNFQSYLYKSRVQGYGLKKTHSLTAVRGYYKMANKAHSTHWLTRYDEFTKAYDSTITSKAAAITANVTTNINSYYTNNTSHMNMYNALKHTENNGENAITWLTFKNTSFTFNIAGYCSTATSGSEAWTLYSGNDNIETLFWVWCIDAFQPSNWFRIKMENVRI